MSGHDIWHVVQQVLGVFGGLAVIAIGISRWAGNLWLGRAMEAYRAHHSKELEELKSKYAHELESYKSDIDRAVFVTRAQFETEFDAMKRVF